MFLIDSALRISSTIIGSISAAVSARRCTDIQEESEEITDTHNRDGESAELHFLTDCVTECINAKFSFTAWNPV